MDSNSEPVPLVGTVNDPGLRNITQISLWDNALTGTVPSSLGQLGLLKKLEIYDNYGITGAIPESLCEIESLWQDGPGVIVDCDLVDCTCNATCVCS